MRDGAGLLFDAQLRQVALELESAEPVSATIPAFEAFALCAALQLAWRHPALRDVQRAIVEKATRDLQVAIAQRSPTAGELLEHGWNRALDTPVPVVPCETHSCTGRAAAMVNWPGQKRVRMCPPCIERAKGIADALGFTPFIEDLR